VPRFARFPVPAEGRWNTRGSQSHLSNLCDLKSRKTDFIFTSVCVGEVTGPFSAAFEDLSAAFEDLFSPLQDLPRCFPLVRSFLFSFMFS